MADTPLELYEEAYRLHYHEKKIPDAVKIYETIISDFPDSNECGYAFIQLQKVKANDISKAIKKGPAALYPMVIVAFISSIIALTLTIVAAVFLFQQLRIEHHRSTLALIALGKMSAGSDEFALKIIEEIKGASPTDVLASEFTSDILARKQAGQRSFRPLSEDLAAKGNFPETTAKPAAQPKAPARIKAGAAARRTAKQVKNPIIYSADSISYF
jgi:hypothetical protein